MLVRQQRGTPERRKGEKERKDDEEMGALRRYL